jgi:hypothetical protein
VSACAKYRRKNSPNNSESIGRLYLAGQLALFSERLVGWKLDHCMASELVIEASNAP